MNRELLLLIVGSFFVLSLSSAANADIFLAENENGDLTLTNRPDQSNVRNVMKLVAESEWPEGQEVPTPAEVEQIVEDAAQKFDLPKSLLFSVIHVESSGDSRAKSGEGARGMMQLMPATAREMGVENIWDPRENVFGGAKYLKKLLDRYKGDLSRTLAAYNAGPGNVKKYDGVPPFPETRRFVKVVRGRFDRLREDRETIYKYRDENGVLHVTNIK